MKKHLKSIVNILFFAAVFGLTIWAVFHDENPRQVLDYLSEVRIIWIIPAIFCVLTFIFGESIILYYLMRSLGTKVQLTHCCLFSFIGFFYSAITPSASGGQPMQVIAMRRDGIATGTATVVLGIVTITYKLVLVVIGLSVLLFRPAAIVDRLDTAVESICYLGLALNVVFIIILLMAVFSPNAIRKLGEFFIHCVNRIRPLRNPQKLYARLDNLITQYSGTSDYFKAHPIVIANVFIVTLVQRFCLFSVIYFTYRAFDHVRGSFTVLVLLYAMISVAVDMLPLPGGMGISESLFLAIFEPIFGEALVVPAMVVCRGISYYTQLLISAVMTGVSQLVFRKKKKT